MRLENKMSTKQESFFHMDKWTKISMVIGGVYGLINGILYIFVLGWTALGEMKLVYIFTQTSLIWKIVYLPMYLTHKLILLPMLKLGLFIQIFSLINGGLLIFFILMSTLFGVGIGFLVAMIINRVKKVLEK